MGLSHAHEGYEYQDLITCYFILQEIINENKSEFIIDKKEFTEDKLDDLTIYRRNKKFKKQIKYSNTEVDHRLQKKDISSDSLYNLSLDTLFYTWFKSTQRESTEFRICLSWKPPTDELLDILVIVPEKNSFNNWQTIVYQIDGQKLWPKNAEPSRSWQRFRAASKSICRDKFLEFCDALIIEVLMPKLSLNLNQPGDLERLVLNQATILGMGVFPNEKWRPETFILSLLEIVKRSRSKSLKITTDNIFHELGIVTDYGSIEQEFPIIQNENIDRKSSLETFLENSSNKNKMLLIGEPGSGKSWFVENLTNLLKAENIKVVRHFCYTKMDDVFQRQRIQLNVFYGNLIADLVRAFPDLKKYKDQKYASSLHELNNLLLKIDQPTYLFIDGLDHIDRIAAFRNYTDISQQDIAIIENIAKLAPSQFVRIIVTSQNIEKLNLIKNFEIINLPEWQESDIIKLLQKKKIINRNFKKETKLSKFLLEKSAGNPLYLKYLLDEIIFDKKLIFSELNSLPDYSFNLKEYYEYLLTKLNTREDVPQILSGVGFSLSKTDLEEITFAGEFVSESLRILAPVLTINISRNGYRIYHESFRRFILDHLESRSISIERKIFKPIQEWFAGKDFYKHQKCYRYYLQFLYEGGHHKDILDKLSHTFVTDSIENGYSWELIEKNYKYFVKSACYDQDFSNVILLNEIDKVLASCKDDFENIFPLYINALGKVYGYSRVSEYLVYDGLPTMPLSEGIKACYICDENNIAAPWNLYMENYIAKGDDLKYFLRGLLVLGNKERINKIALKIESEPESKFAIIFREQLASYANNDFVKELESSYPAVKTIISYQAVNSNSLTKEAVMIMAKRILKFDNIFTEEAEIIGKFFIGFKEYLHEEDLCIELERMFRGRNWFYNWLIYALKILKIDSKSSYIEIKSAFDYLKYNTEPFLGKPRTCDLYSIHGLIYQTIHKGLKFIKSREEWDEIIEILVEVSDDTTTSIQRSFSGPLSTDRLFEILTDFVCSENIIQIKKIFEEVVDKKKNYHLHCDIAEYILRLASLMAVANQQEEAENYFKEAIQYSLAYTMRKDLTLMDVINGMTEYLKFSPTKKDETLKLSKTLVDSVVSHTDGKSTSHFPVIWFENFVKIDRKQAMLYLLKQLSENIYDWRLEDSLVELLLESNGTINSTIEGYIALTFPVNKSEKFVTYCLNIYKNLKTNNPSLAKKLSARIIYSMNQTSNTNHSDKLVTKFNDLLGEETGVIPIKKVKRSYFREKDKWYNKCNERKFFSSMTEDELLTYIECDKFEVNDLLPFSYILDDCKDLNEFIKQFISTIVIKNSARIYEKLDLDLVFHTENDIECYYWVCRFVNDYGGWYEKFINQEAFKKAYKINSNLALSTLFDLLPHYLEVGFNNEFSSNLIRLLVSLDYDPIVIDSMWQNLITMSIYRLPVQSELNWPSETQNCFDMDEEEILIALLISRYQGGTTERFRWVTTALTNLFNDNSQKLIKPFLWFFKNQALFPNSAILIILQLLYQEKQKKNDFHLHFKNILSDIFPSHYFIKDFMIASLYGLRLSSIILKNDIAYTPISDQIFHHLYNTNGRFRFIEGLGVDLDCCFSKFLNIFKIKYKDYFEYYTNRSYNRIVPNIWQGECLLSIVNEDNYQSLKETLRFLDEADFVNYSFLDKDAIVNYTNSLGRRPEDLLFAHKFPTDISDNALDNEQEWVRIAHHEEELKGDRRSEMIQYRSFGGVIFGDLPIEEGPYSNISTLPFTLWSEDDHNFPISNRIIFSIFQNDPIENFKILWINPSVLNMMKLKTKSTHEGLVAVNNENTVVVRMRSWCVNYIGTGFNTRLDDEIPTLEGVDLIIKREYLVSLEKYFNQEPSYRSVAIVNS